MGVIKDLFKDWLPPVVVRNARNLLGGGIRFKGNYSNWSEAASHCTGYDANVILERVLAAALKVKFGEAMYERDSVLFEEIEYSWPVTAALMLVAARNNGKLNVLDFGGSLGSGYFQNRKFLSNLNSVTWSIVEQPHFVEAGRRYIEDSCIKFYPSIEILTKNTTPNCILLCSVAQYLPNIDEVMKQMNMIDADVLVIDRSPFTCQSENRICRQHVPAEIYNASYPMWLLSRSKILNQLSNWRLLESFSGTKNQFRAADSEFEFGGYIFEKSKK